MPRQVKRDRKALLGGVGRFLSDDEKHALAESGEAFPVNSVEFREKGGFKGKGDAWSLLIELNGEERKLGFADNDQRNVQFMKLRDDVKSNGPLPDCALLQLPAKGKRTGAYILIDAEAHPANQKQPAKRKKAK